MKRKPVIAGNWKMNKTTREAMQFVTALEGKLPDPEKVEAVICAPYVHLSSLVHWAEHQNLKIGAQNMHERQHGAYTGEISPLMLQDLGVEYVIIGHSERRQYYNETDESVNLKLLAAVRHHLTPIICVGEQMAEREAQRTKEVVRKQVVSAFRDVPAEQVAQTVIAYEPIWAIGTGKTATVEDANDVIGYIRAVIGDLYHARAADSIRLLYGGSVKPENIRSFMSQADIDGALVGGASLEAASFLQLLEGGQ